MINDGILQAADQELQIILSVSRFQTTLELSTN